MRNVCFWPIDISTYSGIIIAGKYICSPLATQKGRDEKRKSRHSGMRAPQALQRTEAEASTRMHHARRDVSARSRPHPHEGR